MTRFLPYAALAIVLLLGFAVVAGDYPPLTRWAAATVMCVSSAFVGESNRRRRQP